MTATSATSASALHPYDGQALISRMRFFIAMAASALIFWHVGWAVAGPADPNGPVTLLSMTNGVIGMAELLGLCVAAAGLATAICGPRSGHRGPMAIAVGLAALAMRGGFMDEFVRARLAAHVLGGATGPGRDVFPRGEFIAEGWLWFFFIGVGFVVGRWVESWHGAEASAPPSAAGPHVDSAAEVRQGLAALVVNVLVAYNLIGLFGGRSIDAYEKGQIYFAIGGAFFVSTLLSHLCFKATSRVWLLVAAAVVSTVVYVWNGPAAKDLAAGGYVVLPTMVRAMPVEFAALAVVGSLAGFNLRERLTAPPETGAP